MHAAPSLRLQDHAWDQEDDVMVPFRDKLADFDGQEAFVDA